MNYTIQNDWIKIFRSELSKVDSIEIISPFVSKGLVDDLINHCKNGFKNIKFITRFNLNDFRSGVSSISALERLIDSGVEIHGIKDLHSKVYLFSNTSVIIGSANFTNGGFYSNYEFGVFSDESNIVLQTQSYFNKLWSVSDNSISKEEIKDWKLILSNNKKESKEINLPDFGKQIVTSSFEFDNNKRQVFIKFFGKAEYRANLDYSSQDEIERSHCHWALTFSGRRGRHGNGRPRKYKNGDIVYMARMLEGNDYAIFGKGIALQHVDDRDYASEEDIEEIDWKEDWPVYIRVYDTIFINSTMRDCPKLSSLMSDMQFQSFPTTLARHINGEKNINPKSSLKQKADIQLTNIAFEWLETKFQEAINRCGKVDQDYLDSLYQGTPSNDEIL